jgi:hypothetical protein
MTQEYISSYQLNQIYSIIDPIRIAVRTQKLDAWTKHMNESRDVFLKYTSKRAGVANGWKKWQGEVRGLRINDVVNKKRQSETEYQQWALSENTLPFADDLLTNIYANTSRADSALKAETYLQEAFYGIELMQQTAVLDRMLQVLRSRMPEQRIKDSIQKLAKSLDGFYKNYDLATDRDLFSSLMPVYYRNSGSWVSSGLRKTVKEYRNDFTSLGADIYGLSLLADKSRLEQFVSGITVSDTMRILSDPAWRLYNTVSTYRKEKILPVLTQYTNKLNYQNRLYMKAQMQKNWNSMAYPDANMTLRLTYGKVEGMDPDGPADYSFQTNLDEIMEKDNPEVEEFRVPMKLKELHGKKDYGRWAVNGTVPVAFIASNHTSGGNSGSPVLNAKGQLIGINFDRVWEGTMSDLYFDPKLSRNISLDIRYTLFVIEKMGGAGWLLKEMSLVK